MRFVPVFAALLCASRLFGAASGGTTAIDSAGNVWRTGTTGFMLTTATAFQKSASFGVCGTQNISPFQPPTFLTCNHAYLSKQDPAGNVLYATYLGGTLQDGGTALTVDAQGNVYVAGYTYSADFPVTPGAVQPTNAGPTYPAVYTSLGAPFGLAYLVAGGDVFVSKFASDGALLFSTFLGGSGSDVPTLIGVDASGSIYVAGVTQSSDFPLTANARTGQASANFFARLNATGTVLTYSTYYQSSILAFDVDNQSRAYLTGDYLQSGQPYVAVIDTSTGTAVNSAILSSLQAKLAGAGVAIGVSTQSLMVAVSPAPQPYDFRAESAPARVLGDSYLLELPLDTSAILAETTMRQTQFDSILFDTSNNAYTFGHGSGAIPATPIQLAGPCSQSAASFVLETNPASDVVTATYFRQGDDTAIAINTPGHVSVYRSFSNTTVTMDLTAHPPALFGCPANLASDVANQGIAPGEIFLLTGTGLGPTQGIGAIPNAAGQYPATLGGVQVLFGSKPVPLLYVQANEIHAVAPFSLNSVTAVQVQYGTESVEVLDAQLSSLNPGIFIVNGQGAIINQDGTVNTPANPAKLGSFVSVYCTGMGYLEMPVTDGSVAPIPPPYNVTQLADPELRFAGVPGTTIWSGAAPGLIEGATQINVQLPATLPSGTNLSAVPVILNAAGTFSPPVPISVKQ